MRTQLDISPFIAISMIRNKIEWCLQKQIFISFLVATVNRNSEVFVYHGCNLNFLLFSIQVIFPEPRAINRQKNKTPLFCCYFERKGPIIKSLSFCEYFRIRTTIQNQFENNLTASFFQSIFFFIFDAGISITFIQVKEGQIIS